MPGTNRVILKMKAFRGQDIRGGAFGALGNSTSVSRRSSTYLALPRTPLKYQRLVVDLNRAKLYITTALPRLNVRPAL